MSQISKDLWGVLALRGIVAILFGLAAVFWPQLTLVTLVYLVSAFLLASGVVGLVVGLINIGNGRVSFLSRVLTILISVAEIGVGVYLIRHAGIAFAAFVLIVGLILIARGIVDIFSAIFEEEAATSKTILVITGVLSVIVGVILLMQPAAAGVAFVWVLGLYSLITGPMLIALAYDIKK